MTVVKEQTVSSETYYGCTRARTDYWAKAQEERALCTELASRIHDIAEKTILMIGLILVTALAGTFLATSFSSLSLTTAFEPVMLKTFQGIGLVLSLTVPTLLYNVYLRSSHLKEARNCEQIAINANIKAAERPAWEYDYGYIPSLFGRVFSMGMFNTASGSGESKRNGVLGACIATTISAGVILSTVLSKDGGIIDSSNFWQGLAGGN